MKTKNLPKKGGLDAAKAMMTSSVPFGLAGAPCPLGGRLLDGSSSQFSTRPLDECYKLN